jgi:hypothetical protein
MDDGAPRATITRPAGSTVEDLLGKRSLASKNGLGDGKTTATVYQPAPETSILRKRP